VEPPSTLTEGVFAVAKGVKAGWKPARGIHHCRLGPGWPGSWSRGWPGGLGARRTGIGVGFSCVHQVKGGRETGVSRLRVQPGRSVSTMKGSQRRGSLQPPCRRCAAGVVMALAWRRRRKAEREGRGDMGVKEIRRMKKRRLTGRPVLGFSRHCPSTGEGAARNQTPPPAPTDGLLCMARSGRRHTQNTADQAEGYAGISICTWGGSLASFVPVVEVDVPPHLGKSDASAGPGRRS
jgi:hypothetical protein